MLDEEKRVLSSLLVATWTAAEELPAESQWRKPIARFGRTLDAVIPQDAPRPAGPELPNDQGRTA